MWCSQCYAKFEQPPEAANEPAQAFDPFRKADAIDKPLNARYSRWAKSETTFGPFGRIVASLSLLIPLAFFVNSGMFGVVGIIMWIFVVMPMALRSIWKRGLVVEDR